MKISRSLQAILWSREQPLAKKELEGFGPAKSGGVKLSPYVKISGPSKEDGMKGWKINIGVKGTF